MGHVFSIYSMHLPPSRSPVGIRFFFFKIFFKHFLKHLSYFHRINIFYHWHPYIWTHGRFCIKENRLYLLSIYHIKSPEFIVIVKSIAQNNTKISNRKINAYRLNGRLQKQNNGSKDNDNGKQKIICRQGVDDQYNTK